MADDSDLRMTVVYHFRPGACHLSSTGPASSVCDDNKALKIHEWDIPRAELCRAGEGMRALVDLAERAALGRLSICSQGFDPSVLHEYLQSPFHALGLEHHFDAIEYTGSIDRAFLARWRQLYLLSHMYISRSLEAYSRSVYKEIGRLSVDKLFELGYFDIVEEIFSSSVHVGEMSDLKIILLKVVYEGQNWVRLCHNSDFQDLLKRSPRFREAVQEKLHQENVLEDFESEDVA